VPEARLSRCSAGEADRRLDGLLTQSRQLVEVLAQPTRGNLTMRVDPSEPLARNCPVADNVLG